MKVKKQLRKLQALLDPDHRDSAKQQDKLKDLLRRMKSKEKHLVKKLETERDTEKKKRLEQEIALVHAQRKKGIKVLQDSSD